MTSNSEEVTSQPRPVSSNSADVSLKEEKPPTPETKTKEKHPEKVTSEHDELIKSGTSNIDLEENSTPENQNEGKIEQSQHEITTILEETERDVNESITFNRGNHYDSDIEGMEENQNCCLRCLTDVFYCITWYFRNIKSLTVSCFRQCCNCSSQSVDSDEPDANYIYSDLNETFNNDISGTNEGLSSAGNYSFDNSGADVGHKKSYDVGPCTTPDLGGTFKSGHHGDTFNSAGDVGTSHSRHDDGAFHSGGDAGTCSSDVGNFSSGADVSFDTSGGDGGGDCGGGSYD